MKSKDKLLQAIKGERIGKIPLSIYFNTNLRIPNYDLTNLEQRVKAYLSLGCEPVIDVDMPQPELHKDVKVKIYEEFPKNEKYPIIYKEYQTPGGLLRQGEKKTPDWPFGMDIPHPGNDQTASNIYEPLIKDDKDVDKLAFLWQKPTSEQIEQVRKKNEEKFAIANKYGVLTRATVGQGLATPMLFIGAQNLVYFSYDEKEAFHKLALMEKDVVFERIKIAKDYGVDLLKRFGGYEQTNFFTPTQYDDHVIDYLKETVKEAHKYDLPIYYRVVTGMKPLLSRIASLGFDIVEGFEPELSDCSNQEIHDAFKNKTCVWTGVSSPICLGYSDDKKVRQAVRECMEIFSDTPFILGVTNSIRNHWSFDNTLALVDEYKKLIR